MCAHSIQLEYSLRIMLLLLLLSLHFISLIIMEWHMVGTLYWQLHQQRPNQRRIGKHSLGVVVSPACELCRFFSTGLKWFRHSERNRNVFVVVVLIRANSSFEFLHWCTHRPVYRWTLVSALVGISRKNALHTVGCLACISLREYKHFQPSVCVHRFDLND